MDSTTAGGLDDSQTGSTVARTAPQSRTMGQWAIRLAVEPNDGAEQTTRGRRRYERRGVERRAHDKDKEEGEVTRRGG